MFLMSIIVQILGDTAEDIAAQAATYFGFDPGKAPKKATTKAEKAADKADAGGAAAGGTGAGPAAPAPAGGTGVTFDEFFAALGEYDKKFTRPKAKELLKKYGATKSSEVKVEQLAAITAEIRAALGAGAAVPAASSGADEL